MDTPYFLERSGGQWSGRWYCQDEDRTYRRTWDSPSQCEQWCRKNGFRFVHVTDGLGVIRFNGQSATLNQ